MIRRFDYNKAIAWLYLAMVLILGLVTLCGCKVQKHTVETIEKVEKARLDSIAREQERKMSEWVQVWREMLRQNITTNTDEELTTKRTEWSEPDSAGRQYPLVTEEATKRKKTQTEECVEKAADGRQTLAENEESTKDTATSKDSDNKSSSKSDVGTNVKGGWSPGWILLAVCAIAGCVMLLAILKKLIGTT